MIKQIKNEIDFTTGSIAGNTLRFIIPVFLMNVLQTVYGIVDVLIISHFAEISDIAAVNSGAQFMDAVVGVMGGLYLTVTVLMGRASGKNDEREKSAVLASSALIYIIIAVFLTVFIVCFTSPIVGFLKVPQESYSAAVDYLRICGLGSVIIIAYSFFSSVFHGSGDSVTPLKAVLISTVVNLAGDYIMVGCFGMGAKGAAIATVLAQCISALICVFSYMRKHGRTQPIKLGQSRKETVVEFLKLGVPFVLQEILISFSFVIILMIINSLGLEKAASVGIAEKICSFTLMIPNAGKKSITVSTAQCAGAGMPERARLIARKAIAWITGICVIVAVLLFLYSEFLISLFKDDPEIMYQGSLYLKAFAVNCLLLGLRYGLIGFLNGYKKSKSVLAASLVAAFFIRIPVAYVMSLADNVSLFNIGLSVPVSAVAEILICAFAVRKIVTGPGQPETA